jgi:hypothetical protein
VTRTTFEVLTLGTLVVIVIFGLIGYVVAKPVREQTATIELPTDLAGAVGEVT